MKTFKKKSAALIIGMSLIASTTANAQSVIGNAGMILAAIKANTDKILVVMQQTPAYLQEIQAMAIEWIKNSQLSPDYQNNIIATDQALFGSLNAAYTTAAGMQEAAAIPTISKIFQNGGTNPPIYANILTPTILLKGDDGKINPLSKNGIDNGPKPETIEDDVARYISNVAGAQIILKQPNTALWSEPETLKAYKAYYDTLVSIANYNAYVMGSILHQSPAETAIEQQLVAQSADASKNGFFAQIATEPLALVLRQILMYSSQTYIELVHLVHLQEQQLTTLSMFVSLGILQTSNTIGPMLTNNADQANHIPLKTPGYTAPHL